MIFSHGEEGRRKYQSEKTMNALALTMVLIAPPTEDDLTRAMREVLGRASRLHTEAYFSRCAGVCEGALMTLRGRVKDGKLKRRIEIGLVAADLEPTPQRQANRLMKLLGEVCKGMGVEAPIPAVVAKKPVAKTEKADAVAASKGAPPAGAVGRQVTIVADVVAVDPAKQLVTLKGPKQTVNLRIADPAQFRNIAKGDQVEATFTQAVAVAVQPSAKK